jgi:hypothetical protein
VADLALSGEDAERSHRRVLTWFASRWRNHQPKRAEKPHSITRWTRKNGTLSGPATRPKTPLAVENSVGKLAAPETGRQMPARGKKVANVKKDAAEDKSDAAYSAAKEKCDAMSGDAKDNCIKQAKARYGKA